MKYAFSLFTVLFLATTSLSFAHEGHEDLPGSVQAPKGGFIKLGHDKYLEAVVKPGLIEVYAYDHDLKPLSIEDLSFEAGLTVPRNPKAQEVKLEKKDDHWVISIKEIKTHRFTLTLTDLKEKMKTRFTIEPRR